MYPAADSRPSAPKPITLNQRLANSAEQLLRQCQRVESVLSRINGTPPAPGTGSDNIAKISSTPPLLSSVDSIEQQAERLARLADGLENVA